MLEKHPAIVLRTAPVRESDTLLVMLVQEIGKTAVIARGAKRSKKRFSGGIDLFDYGICRFRFPSATHHGATHKCGSIEGIDEREHWPSLRADLSKFIHASFCLEITDAFLQESDPEGSLLFRSLFLALRNIHKNTEIEAIIAIAINYSLEVLQVSGFDLLEHPDEIPSEIRPLLVSMNETKKPLTASTRSIAETALGHVKRYIENVLGRKLRSL